MTATEPLDEIYDEGLEIRELATDFRIDNVDERTFTAIAVPYGEISSLRDGEKETFDYGSAIPHPDGTVIKDKHKTVIGVVTSHEQTPEGLKYTGRISKTTAGNDAYELLKDKAYRFSSVGFAKRASKMERDHNGVNHIQKTIIPEISLTELPAYRGAKVLSVREREQKTTTIEQEHPQMPETQTITLEDIQGVDELREEFERLISTEIGKLDTRESNEIDTTSAGELLKAIVAGDELAIRAYTGATTAETVMKSAWVGDLSRLVDEASTLVNRFNTDKIPEQGESVEFAEITANSIDTDFAKQTAEGADLAYGEITTDTRTAPVETYGGYTQLTRKQIERSYVNVLDTNLKAMSIGAGKALNRAFRTHFTTAAAAQVTATNTVTIEDTTAYDTYIEAAIDAAVKMDTLGLSLDFAIADVDAFKKLMALKATDGRPLMLVTGNGANTVGNLDIRALSGDLATIPVYLDPAYNPSGSFFAFANRNAITTYKSPFVTLSDENIINLSKTFSVYAYAAFANEIPQAIIPAILDPAS